MSIGAPYTKISIYDGNLAVQAFEVAGDKPWALGTNITTKAGYGNSDAKNRFDGVIAKFAMQTNQDWFSTVYHNLQGYCL